MAFNNVVPFIAIILSITSFTSYSSSFNILHLRGGAMKARKEGSPEYYDQFDLDYGKDDNARIAGALRGFLKTGKLANREEDDLFLKWMNVHLETGPEPLDARTKPFYALDIGSKCDLKRGENPKIMIVTRKLAKDSKGVLVDAPTEIDIEKREIWQPWLKSRCDFVVRYIVPSRINIIKIMESKNRFSSQLLLEDGVGKQEGDRKAWIKMTFRPKLIERFLGKRNVVIKRELDANSLFGPQKKTKTLPKSAKVAVDAKKSK
eukprot:gene5764-11652_t